MTDPQPAVPQLVALASAMRPDWDSEDLGMAILAASQAGWEWERIAREVWRLLWIEDGAPASLRAACRSPLDRPQPGGWTPAKSGAPKSEEVRAMLDAARSQCDAITPVMRKDDPPRTAA